MTDLDGMSSNFEAMKREHGDYYPGSVKNTSLKSKLVENNSVKIEEEMKEEESESQ